MIYLIVEADLLGKARIIEGQLLRAGRNISYEKKWYFLRFSGLGLVHAVSYP